MNTELLNFIIITNPIGMLFIEFGGIYIGKDIKKLYFISEKEHHKEFILNNNSIYPTYSKINISNDYNLPKILKSNNIDLNKIGIDYNIIQYLKKLNINGYNDYYIPSISKFDIIKNYLLKNNLYLFFILEGWSLIQYKTNSDNKLSTYYITPMREILIKGTPNELD